MIAKRTIIGVFLNSHDLDCIISILGNSGKSETSELIIGTDPFLILSHSDVTFIYKERFCIRSEFLNLEFVRVLGCIYLSREDMCLLILHHATCISRDTLSASAVPFHKHLVEIAVLHGIGREFTLPVAILQTCECVSGIIFAPVVECAHQMYGRGVRRIFAEHPSILLLMQTEIVVSIGEAFQRTASVGRKLLFLS